MSFDSTDAQTVTTPESAPSTRIPQDQIDAARTSIENGTLPAAGKVHFLAVADLLEHGPDSPIEVRTEELIRLTNEGLFVEPYQDKFYSLQLFMVDICKAEGTAFALAAALHIYLQLAEAVRAGSTLDYGFTVTDDFEERLTEAGRVKFAKVLAEQERAKAEQAELAELATVSGEQVIMFDTQEKIEAFFASLLGSGPPDDVVAADTEPYEDALDHADPLGDLSDDDLDKLFTPPPDETTEEDPVPF